ncbi:MAG TPA: phosphotransferase [Candidatus Acidoferrales bacterium]|nr:phosphotransferase [Candidatus Acidoferrales bacterium]
MSEPQVHLIRSADEVTPEWLTSVLRHSGLARSACVVRTDRQTVGTGQMGSSVRYTLTCDRPEPGVPLSVVCKFASNDPTSRATGVALRTYEVEVNFYRQLARTVDIRTPACHFADIDLATGEFVLVLEDLTPCAQGDQLAGCSADHAALAMEELARLHAPRWSDPALARLEWLNRNTPESMAMTMQLLPGLLPGFLERYSSRLEPEYQRLAVLLMENLGAWFEQREEPFAVQHGDYRLDNMLFGSAEGGYPLAVVDWQTVTWGPPLSDASYFLGAGLTVDERRKHERLLLRLYYDALRARGVEISWDRCWADYRRYSFAGLLMAIGASMMVVQTERGDAMFMTMARRHGAQILDLEAEDILRRTVR